MTTTTDSPIAPTPSPAPAKKSSLAKKLLKLAALLLVLVVIGLVVLFLNLNTLVKAGVIRGGHYATDQNTNLNAANLSFANNSLTLEGFDIDNLKGYAGPKLLSMKSCSTTVQASSLFSNTVDVQSILIDGLDVNLEQNGMKNNINELIEIVNKKTASTGNTQNTSPGKNLKIGLVSLKNTKVHIRSAAPLNLNLDFTLPDLEIIDPTNPDGRPMKIADLIGKILVHLGKQIIENPQLPGDIRNQMKQVTAIVDNLKGELDKNVKQFQNIANDLKTLDVKNLDPQKLQNMGSELQNSSKGLQDAGKNLGNLFNGGKKDPPK